jgi:ATP phosphoribosyltransferase
MSRTDIRLALPSKGRLQIATTEFLAHCGFEVKQSSTRGYIGTVSGLPSVTVLFQRPRDIIVSVANGGVDFGITGYDVIADANVANRVTILHDKLGYGKCKLAVAVPETWHVYTLADLRAKAQDMARAGAPLRVVTTFHHITQQFFNVQDITPIEMIDAEGSLEVLPEIGAADIIVDLVETGSTLQQNRLRMLSDGIVLSTQASLVANAQALERLEVKQVAIELLEYIEAHLRAQGYFMIVSNVRGESLEHVGRMVTTQTNLGGLQGPTIAPIYPNPASAAINAGAHWYSVTVVVSRKDMTSAITQLRGIGGSGVVVTPVTYIFEEQPERVVALIAKNA